MLARRNFLRGAVAAPFAAKRVAEQAAASLSQLSVGAVGAGPIGYGAKEVPSVQAAQSPLSPPWAKALANATIRKDLESIYFERERGVSHIDHDLAVLRSVSLSAKITYQRERNVRRSMDGLVDEQGWYGRFAKIAKKVAGL